MGLSTPPRALPGADVRVVSAEVRPYAFPLAITTARGAVAERRGWHLRLETERAVGWGDAAPWPGFGARLPEVGAALFAAAELLPGQSIAGSLETLRSLPSPAAHGIEQALLDALARATDRPLAALLSDEPPLGAVRTHRLVTEPDAARAAVQVGYRALKIKVGAAPLAADLARVRAIRDAAPTVQLRLDANGAWDRATAAAAAKAVAELAPAWIEQPLPADDLEGLRLLSATSPVPIALDETVAHLGADAIDPRLGSAVVIKPMFVGGLRQAMSLARRAVDRGLRVGITHALESRVGRRGALHLAAALGAEHAGAVHGLGGAGPDGRDGPTLGLSAGPGLGGDLVDGGPR